jgi:hypothetical protein
LGGNDPHGLTQPFLRSTALLGCWRSDLAGLAIQLHRSEGGEGGGGNVCVCGGVGGEGSNAIECVCVRACVCVCVCACKRLLV